VNISNYAVARALVEQHDFDFDIAYLSVWYSVHDETSTESPAQIIARMHQCQYIPQINEKMAVALLSAYTRHKGGPTEARETK
jgi:hypothetical protein